MVFSQTSHKTQNLLKVVEIDILKADKNQQVDCATEVVADVTTPPSSVANNNNTEEYLKQEPMFDGTMFHDSSNELFQDLVQWCYDPAKAEPQQIIDSPKLTEARAHNTDTLHTPLSPQGWDVFDVNSPTAQTCFYNTTPNKPLSPNVDGGFGQFESKSPYLSDLEKENKLHFQEQFLDISSLPVVIEELASKSVIDTNPWQATEMVDWTNTYDTVNTKSNTDTQNTMPFIDQEDSLDLKSTTYVIPRQVESNDIIISEYLIKGDTGKGGVLEETRVEKRGGGLSVNVASFGSSSSNVDVITTPEVLSYVEQMEKEKCPLSSSKLIEPWSTQEDTRWTTMWTDICSKTNTSSPIVDYEPITPKSESIVESDNDDTKSRSSKKRHHDSEDSDETYTPYSERTTPRKYKRRKPNVPIKDMILALEGSQQLTKARRGRPPKRRESTVSSVCSIDDNSSSISTQETKYRELRDKNNEASKRSRMNRKLKELQMEQLVVDLEERNKKLKVKADILEDMTKRLKEALMTAILQK